MNATKEHIIIVASKLFLQKSFKEATMKDIVNETGLSKGAFYHYFTSKEQLFLETLEYLFNTVFIHRYDKYSRKSFYQFYHDYINAVKTMGQSYFEKLNENEKDEISFNINHFDLVFDALKLFPEFKEKAIIQFDGELNLWADSVRRARERGEIASAMSDEQIAKMFIYLSDGIAMHMIIRGVSVDEIIKPTLDLWDNLYEQIKA